ncbi:hypothetical protein UFOVP397_21 [uncultured Caudovirales phage]|uniref:DUF6378 domain-containing protein n=1 Tax=uncultured Caudovirales phage TaxID=2100421 RepID=A0A6J5LZH5_9CAUD|nr:hypothetical protein UFOVP397_21 [uncultured Caudovirales phage]
MSKGDRTKRKAWPPAEVLEEARAAGMLHEAAQIVAGARSSTHGAAERSFAAIGALWTAYLRDTRLDPSAPISAQDVAWMMTLLKVARSQQGEPVRDHYVDGAGYAALAGELAGV